MKKWFPTIPFTWPSLLLLVLIQLDSYKHHLILGQSCGPRISPRQMKEIPCDLSVVSYCLKPGSAYPWSSVRRYIFDNQGFVKKMYGEQRQSQIIHDELTRINRKYKDVGSETSLRNARKKNFRHFRDHHETNQEEKIKNGDNTEIDPNITMVFNYMDELNQHNVDGDNGEDNEPFTYHQDYEVGLTTLLYLVDSASTTQSSTVIDNTGDTGQFTTTLDSNADDDKLSDGSKGEPQHQDHQDDDEDDDGPIKGYNACPITQEVVAPYWANNTRGETLALLNVYPFEQYIHWEKCSYEGEKMFCRDGCKCEQQFRLHRLLAFDPKNECRGIFADWFRFPGCCVCICYDNYNHERINNRKARL